MSMESAAASGQSGAVSENSLESMQNQMSNSLQSQMQMQTANINFTTGSNTIKAMTDAAKEAVRNVK